MPDETICPFFEKDVYNESGEPVGIECHGAEIQFKCKETRRGFVYPWCGSIDGFKNCKIYRTLSEGKSKHSAGNGNRKV